MSGADLGALLPAASSADIVRAALKDEEYIAALSARADALARDVLPNAVRSSPAVASALSGLARGMYFALALRRAPRRTPGDEYVAVLPVRPSTPGTLAPPGPAAAAALAALHALGRPFALALLRTLWRRGARLVRAIRTWSAGRDVGTPLVPRAPPFPSHAVEAALFFAERAHLAAFYIAGVYYCVPNRLLRMRYVRTAAPAVHTDHAANRYQFLGVLVGIQLLGAAAATARSVLTRIRRQSRPTPGRSILQVARLYTASSLSALLYPHGTGDTARDDDSQDDSDASDDEGEETVRIASSEASSARTARDSQPTVDSALASSGLSRSPRRKCPLCLGSLKSPALTSCGHVFCWSCVAGWCATQEMCPICRQPIQMHRDLYLVSNY